MAGSLALIQSDSTENSAIVKDQWEVSFSRFVVSPSLSSTCSSLVPLPHSRRQPRPRGTWISSESPNATLQLSYHSISDVILSVSLSGYILEEHYVSKLHFTWPQVTCLSGFFPPRGSRAVFVSYRDSLGELQKFALRFASVSEAETFINELKDILKDFTETAPPNSGFQSEISFQSEFLSTRSPSRVSEEESTVISPIIRNSDQLLLSLGIDVEGDSSTKNIAPSHHSEGEYAALPSYFPSVSTACNELISNNEVEVVSCNDETTHYYPEETSTTAFPPSFASFLANCYPEVEQATATAQKSLSGDNDLKSEIARLMEDSSFQEMLMKVEKVINEIGDDLLL